MKTLLLVSSIALLFVAHLANAQVCTNYGQIDTTSRDLYVLNNGYKMDTSKTDICCWLNDGNSWGGSIDFKQTTGGAGVSIMWGKWPFSNVWTTGSYPIHINAIEPQYSEWNFNLGDISVSNWNMYWEIWTQPCKTTDCYGQVEGDVMIHPRYGEVSLGPKFGSVTFDGVTWDVVAQPPIPSRQFYIVHYYRQPQTTRTGRINLTPFWQHSRDNGWATGYVTGITAGLEMSRGSGSFSTTKFVLDTTRPTGAPPPPMPFALPGKHRMRDSWNGLYATAATKGNYAPLEVNTKLSHPRQMFFFEKIAGNKYRIKNEWTNKYLNAANNVQWTPINGSPTASGEAAQWEAKKVQGNTYRFRNVWNGMYLTSNSQNGQSLQQAYLNTGWTSQMWTMENAN